jgi:DNA replication and repair protein RecF
MQPPVKTGLVRLALYNFRNYHNLDLAITGSPVVLTGSNGAGKTNILEAVSFLSPGKGLRGVKLSQITRLQSSETMWSISATLDTAYGSVQLGTGLDYAPTGKERRLVRINAQPVKNQACLTDYVSVIWVTPQMDRLFLDGASGRRKFIDRIIYALDFTHAQRLHRYEHHLRERTHILRQGQYDRIWIATLERYLAEDGVAIVAARDQGIKSLAEGQCTDINYPFPQFQASMNGEVESWLENEPALAVEDKYAHKLSLARSQDCEAGGASIGPHRSDFIVHHLAKELPAELCSTGEQKMLLLAITLAYAKVQESYRSCPTILLLDEVIAHLDEQHRLVLFEQLCQSGKVNFQVWLTGTHAQPFEKLANEAQFLNIHNATLVNRYGSL